ncbi:MAG: GtrA family protein [Deltaproteobacteria bacterium]|nr:MAG: GtrA family protein [Deltaproteobacteria bacterium]
MRNFRELVASGFGGAVATAVDVSVLVLMVEHGAPIAGAAFCGAALGAVMNFALNKYIAFRDRSSITGHQLLRFGLVAVATAALMALAMHIVAVVLGVPYLLAKLICAVCVFAAWTYPAQRRLVFRRPAHA